MLAPLHVIALLELSLSISQHLIPSLATVTATTQTLSLHIFPHCASARLTAPDTAHYQPSFLHSSPHPPPSALVLLHFASFTA